MVEEEIHLEGWFFHRKGGEIQMIQDLNEGFKEDLRESQDVGEGLIPAGVDIGKEMRFLR